MPGRKPKAFGRAGEQPGGGFEAAGGRLAGALAPAPAGA